MRGGEGAAARGKVCKTPASCVHEASPHQSIHAARPRLEQRAAVQPPPPSPGLRLPQ